MQTCSCGRIINPYADHASFLEQTYCSKYCRIFNERGLKIINGAEKFDKAQYSGFNWWPIIKINCEMCEAPVDLHYEFERANRQFCSRVCFNKMKSVKKRKSQMNYAILRLLRHHYYNNEEGWITASDMSELMNHRRDVKGNPRRWGNMLTKWVKRGLVENKGQHPMQYRLKKEYLNAPLAKIFYEYETHQR